MREENLGGMVRGGDYDTSIMAAQNVAPTRTELQERVLKAFQTYGAMTDGELRELPEFARMAHSTVAKRRTELYQKGIVIPVGRRSVVDPMTSRSRTMTVWNIRREPV